MKRATSVILAGSAILSFPAVGHAQTSTGYGSAVFTTLRACPSDPSATCNGQQAPISQSNLSGGANIAATTTFSPGTGPGVGSSAYGSIHFGDVGLPTISASASAVGQVRVNTNIYFYQTYTYTGADPIDFGLTGNLHIDDSTSDGAAGVQAGGAIINADILIWNAASFFHFTDAASMIDANNATSFAGDCGDDAGILASGGYGGGLPGGEQTYSFSTQSCSGGGAITLHTGDQFVVAGIMQFPVNRGGSIDATHTFTVNLDPSLGEGTVAALRNSLAFTPTPEPATWASMVLGFGLIGAGLRRRTPALAA
jgi:hypothetical protein